MQRVRIGAIGLACVFLLVMLATAFMRLGSGEEALGDNAAEIAANAADAPSEPLAELGVAPGNPEAPPEAPPEPKRPTR